MILGLRPKRNLSQKYIKFDCTVSSSHQQTMKMVMTGAMMMKSNAFKGFLVKKKVWLGWGTELEGTALPWHSPPTLSLENFGKLLQRTHYSVHLMSWWIHLVVPIKNHALPLLASTTDSEKDFVKLGSFWSIIAPKKSTRTKYHKFCGMTDIQKTNGNGVVSLDMCAPCVPCLNSTFFKTSCLGVSSVII